ncbi:MAG: alpha-ketoglutarate-dependent dioxygenase AlkB [Pseudomonadota bacterium]
MDLFANESPLPLRLPDADVVLYQSVILHKPADAILNDLIVETDWQSRTIRLWGREYQQPRLIAWSADKGVTYRYSGVTLPVAPWTSNLLALKSLVEGVADASFNSVLLNYYRDEKDSMGMHSDDEPELGEQPVIASLSFGETRALSFKHRSRRELKSVKVALPSGSLLLMKGDTQKNWKHGMAKQRKACGPRVNLTFRKILPVSNR